MSKPTSVILLCEDTITANLFRSYLKRCGFDNRSIRPVVSPKGRGAGESFVRRQFVLQVNAYRISKAKKATWLIAAIDADSATVDTRLGQLSAQLKDSGDPRIREMRIQDESIACLVPKRNIETWLLVLTGTSATEDADYKETRSKNEWQELLTSASRTLYEWTRQKNELPAECIPSLEHGVRELRHLSRRD